MQLANIIETSHIHITPDKPRLNLPPTYFAEMALVDYSDSDSDSEPKPTIKPQPAPAPTTTTKAAPAAAAANASGKKPFQKVIDRSKPGKILVNLPQTSDEKKSGGVETNGDADDDQPPAKRARIAASGRGAGAFSGFNSFLPAPKNIGKRPAATSGSSNSGGGKSSAPRPGVNLKTGAAPGFGRDADGGDNGYDELGGKVGGGADAAESRYQQQQPSIPAGQKPAEEVKLVGKPMMFKPLSVSRKPAKKKTANKTASRATPASSSTQSSAAATASTATEPQIPAPSTKAEPPKKKVSLFSLSNELDEEENDNVASAADSGIYEPVFDHGSGGGDILSNEDALAQYDAQFAHLAAAAAPAPSHAQQQQPESLDALASDMNLSAAARRELFGQRGGNAATADATGGLGTARVLSFNTDREYAHNEALRATGEQQIYNPVRAIAPGKHNLRQLVNQVHNQRDALEESFAQGKSNKNEAMARYGWR